jgi:imidazolonepropionase-like amidohydrolase
VDGEALIMSRHLKLGFVLAACVAATLVVALRAEAPRAFAITGARIITAAGPTIEAGTVVFRNGLVEAVGADVTAPADAWVIDGKGLSVYPGLIDMGTVVPVEVPKPEPKGDRGSAGPPTTAQVERAKRARIFRPQFVAADHIKTDSPDLAPWAAAGITSMLAVPADGILSGQSALINVIAPEDEPQIGALADRRDRLLVVKESVAQHVTFAEGAPFSGYPDSLMGSIAFVRQAFLDARHARAAAVAYTRKPAGQQRPQDDPGLDALLAALDGKVPVAFAAQESRQIRRALGMAAEFTLDPIIVGGLEADAVAGEIKAASGRVIINLNVPTRPKTMAPEADEPVRVLRQRANALKVPAALDRAGVAFAFQSGGLKEPKDFLKNAARAVKEGLPADAAIRALTIGAARIAGAADRIGSLEPGKIANLIVTKGDLFADNVEITHVFVDGRLVRK